MSGIARRIRDGPPCVRIDDGTGGISGSVASIGSRGEERKSSSAITQFVERARRCERELLIPATRRRGRGQVHRRLTAPDHTTSRRTLIFPVE